MPPPKFFSRFSKKVKHRLAGDGHKPGGSRTNVASVSVDLGKKGVGDEEEVALMGLPLLPANPETPPDGGRNPEFGQNRIDDKKGEVGLRDSSLQLGGEEVREIGRRRLGNEAIVEEEVRPVRPINPPSQSHLRISQDDQGHSGST